MRKIRTPRFNRQRVSVEQLPNVVDNAPILRSFQEGSGTWPTHPGWNVLGCQEVL